MSVDDYRRNLSASVRGLWRRDLTLDDFLWSFGSAIERGLTQAWLEGAAQCGITADELSPEEQIELKRYILMNRMLMGRFGTDILGKMSREEGGKLQPHLDRLKLWVNRWNEVYFKAQAMACADRKMTWVLGATKRHCDSCGAFAGRVYRNSVWLANGALPQSNRLKCKGWACQCRLEPTDARITPGRFPARLLG